LRPDVPSSLRKYCTSSEKRTTYPFVRDRVILPAVAARGVQGRRPLHEALSGSPIRESKNTQSSGLRFRALVTCNFTESEVRPWCGLRTSHYGVLRSSPLGDNRKVARERRSKHIRQKGRGCAQDPPHRTHRSAHGAVNCGGQGAVGGVRVPAGVHPRSGGAQ
jgi:hypothetical protein